MFLNALDRRSMGQIFFANPNIPMSMDHVRLTKPPFNYVSSFMDRGFVRVGVRASPQLSTLPHCLGLLFNRTYELAT